MNAPVTTAILARTWRRMISAGAPAGQAYQLRTAANFANSAGIPPLTAAWYLAAIWRYNQG